MIWKAGFDYIDRGGRFRVGMIPQFDNGDFMCARYARLSAENLFGKKYVRADSWDLKYQNRLVTPEPKLGNASPGDLVTMFNEGSNFNTSSCGDMDSQGLVRNVTHTALLYDFDFSGEPLLLHQWSEGVREIKSLKSMEEEYRLEAREIISCNN